MAGEIRLACPMSWSHVLVPRPGPTSCSHVPVPYRCPAVMGTRVCELRTGETRLACPVSMEAIAARPPMAGEIRLACPVYLVPYPGSISLSTRDGGSGSRIGCGRDAACLSSCRCPRIAVLVALSVCRFAMPVPQRCSAGCRRVVTCLSCLAVLSRCATRARHLQPKSEKCGNDDWTALPAALRHGLPTCPHTSRRKDSS
jgi:hypothetical protein